MKLDRLEIEHGPGGRYSDAIYVLRFRGEPVGVLGVQVPELLDTKLYLTFDPGDGLRASPKLLRAMRREFAAFRNWRLEAIIQPDEPHAARFAQFFGFQFVGETPTGHLYERAL